MLICGLCVPEENTSFTNLAISVCVKLTVSCSWCSVLLVFHGLPAKMCSMQFDLVLQSILLILMPSCLVERSDCKDLVIICGLFL